MGNLTFLLESPFSLCIFAAETLNGMEYLRMLFYPMDLCPSDSSRISDRIGLFEELIVGVGM